MLNTLETARECADQPRFREPRSSWGSSVMTANRLSQISWACGLGTVAFFVVGILLLKIYPPAAGHRSAFFSEAGIVLFVLSFVSSVLAPTALITGAKALRRFPVDMGKSGKCKAWVGVIAGGLYSSILVIPLLVLITWSPVTRSATNDQAVIGVYTNEKVPENTTELRGDGTFIVKERSQSFTGKYRVRGNHLILVLDSGETATGSIQSGALVDPEGNRLVRR